MKLKKSNQANLERSKGTYRQMGIILALGLLFIAFEYSSADIADPSFETTTEVVVDMDYVPITKAEKPDLPPPPNIIFDKIIIDIFNESPEEIITIIAEPDFDVTIFDIPEVAEIDPDKVFKVVESMPKFPGGVEALMRYLSKNIIYPSIAQEMGIQGKVYVQFVVNKNGEIVDITIAKGVDRSLNEEALRVVQNMPNWKPGKQRGKAVNVSYNIPINFKLK